MRFTRIIQRALPALAVVLLAACAHPIMLTPSTLPERNDAQLVNKKVAYVITDERRAVEFTTPGGGGDKVSYFPYRDMEPAIRAALRSVYSDVQALKAAPAAGDSSVSYIFTPVIHTTSSSPSAFTWPPTKFSTELVCTVTDPQGVVVTEVRAKGEGEAEFSEFKSDHSLSARRASDDAAAKLAQQIRADDKLK